LKKSKAILFNIQNFLIYTRFLSFNDKIFSQIRQRFSIQTIDFGNITYCLVCAVSCRKASLVDPNGYGKNRIDPAAAH
jgi:hypothetical protein